MTESKDHAPRHLDLEIAQVDAFTDRVFGGNPAAVVHLSEWPSDATLQAIAAENNLSETAFLVGRIPDDAPPARSTAPAHHLRWFTPSVEVDLCGHATLASAAHLFAAADAGCWDSGACDGDDARDDDPAPSPDRLEFWTLSGWLTATRTRGTIGGDDLFTLDFPVDVPAPLDDDSSRDAIAEALGIDAASIVDTGSGRTKLLVVVDSPELIRPLSPDFAAVARIAEHGIIVTADATAIADGPDADHDVVSRYFAPSIGIDEDPVTGSAHCVLGPYWFDVLGRDRLTAHQASARGGVLQLESDGDRIRISGHAAHYLTGTIRIPVLD